MRTEFAIRFDYGSIVPWVTRQADNSLRAVAGPDMAVLRTAVAMKPKGRMHRAEFVVRADEIVTFVLSYGPSYRDAPEAINPEEALQATLAAWETWAKQGVLLLNAVLTVRAGVPNSHKDRGWETFTDAVIRKVNEKESPVVFALWGKYAQKKESLIDKRHKIVRCAHPSPLSATHGFFGCRPFSKINAALVEAGKPQIDWQIPSV